jgi:hypothetical protein
MLLFAREIVEELHNESGLGCRSTLSRHHRYSTPVVPTIRSRGRMTRLERPVPIRSPDRTAWEVTRCVDLVGDVDDDNTGQIG